LGHLRPPIFEVASRFALLPLAQAVLPAPDGGYGPPDYGTGNTAEGEDALFNLSSGAFNTATGFRSLFSNTTGNFNTAIGAGARRYKVHKETTAQFGLIAEEVAKANPDLVIYDSDGEP
jgi:hypothetical protein